jgi:hypothetical protein
MIQPCKPKDMYKNLMQPHEPIHNYQNIDTKFSWALFFAWWTWNTSKIKECKWGLIALILSKEKTCDGETSYHMCICLLQRVKSHAHNNFTGRYMSRWNTHYNYFFGWNVANFSHEINLSNCLELSIKYPKLGLLVFILPKLGAKWEVWMKIIH